MLLSVKRLWTVLVLTVVLLLLPSLSTVASAAPECPDCKHCTAVIKSVCNLPKPGGTGNTEYLNTVLGIVFAIAASTSVLVVVINGLRYIIVRGDPGATASAKNGIIYSVVGLLVVMSAYSIVVFVVGRTG